MLINVNEHISEYLSKSQNIKENLSIYTERGQPANWVTLCNERAKITWCREIEAVIIVKYIKNVKVGMVNPCEGNRRSKERVNVLA